MSHSGCALVWHVNLGSSYFACPTHYRPSSVFTVVWPDQPAALLIGRNAVTWRWALSHVYRFTITRVDIIMLTGWHYNVNPAPGDGEAVTWRSLNGNVRYNSTLCYQLSSRKVDAQSVINWAVVDQLSWQYLRAPTLDHCSLSHRSSSAVYSTILLLGPISDSWYLVQDLSYR